MDLQLGDRLQDETGEWAIIARPFSTAAGKTVHAPSTHRAADVERTRATQRETGERRAMTRLRRASVIATLLLLTWIATAGAERAWNLWSQGVRNQRAITWFTMAAYPSLNECRTALKEAAETLQNSGYELVDTAESITAMKDDDNFTGLTCLPDTVDPRGPKRK